LIKPILLKFVIEINYLKISGKYFKVKKPFSGTVKSSMKNRGII